MTQGAVSSSESFGGPPARSQAAELHVPRPRVALHGGSRADATHASALDGEPKLRVEPPKLAAFLEETEAPLDLLDHRVVRPRVRPGSAQRIRGTNHA